MSDVVSIRRMRDFSVVNVTRQVGDHKVHWQVRVVGPTKATVVAAIREAQKRLDMLGEAIKEVFG